MQKDSSFGGVLNKNELERRSSKAHEIATQIATTPLEDEPKKYEMDIEGVVEIQLSPDTQKEIGFDRMGKIIPEISWLYVPKDIIEKNITTCKEESDFFFCREQIKNYPGKEVLVGYIIGAHDNDFCLCLSEVAQKYALQTLRKMKNNQKKFLDNLIEKHIRSWFSLGSEIEVDDNIVKNSRPLVEKEIVVTTCDDKREVDFEVQEAEMLTNGIINLPRRASFQNVIRKRYSQGIQACPSISSTTAQTNPGFPRGVWTQYEYKVKTSPEDLKRHFLKNISSYQRLFKGVEDEIKFNEKIDLFKDDYPDLTVDKQDTHSYEQVVYKEYESFINAKCCQGKIISCAEWHPTISGVLALAYAHTRRSLFLHTVSDNADNGQDKGEEIDEFTRTIYDRNFVAIWSMVDKFQPKLFLESPHEVHSLKFSLNGYQVVGGLINGQVILWNIKNRIGEIRELPQNIMQHPDSHYVINSHLGWMKERKPPYYVCPFAISLLQYSQKTCVTGIQWIAPFLDVAATGDIKHLKGDEQSDQFMTCSEDGSVYFWDLKSLNIDIEKQQSERCKEMLPVKPHFQVLTNTQNDNDKDSDHYGIPFSVISSGPLTSSYTKVKSLAKLTKQLTFVTGLKTSGHGEVAPKSIPTSTPIASGDCSTDIKKKTVKNELILGTSTGIGTLLWNESDPESEEQPGPRVGNFSPWADVHDGPISTLERCPFMTSLILSVGGKVFAIWKEGIKEEPVLTKRASTIMTAGSWSIGKPSIFYISYADGRIEVWDLFEKSDEASYTQNISEKLLTGVFPCVISSQYILAVADYNASFRMYHIPLQHATSNNTNLDELHSLIEREVLFKSSFNEWQKNWEIRNANYLKAKHKGIEIESKKKEEEEREMIRKEREIKKKKQQELAVKKLQEERVRARSFTWKLDAERIWNRKQEKHLIHTRLKQKKLNKEELLEKQEPYTNFLEQEKVRKYKQKEMICQKNEVFDKFVSQHFPEITKVTEKEEPIEPEVAVAESVTDYTRKYDEIENETLSYIKNNPLKFEFNWMTFLKEGQNRELCILSTIRKQFFLEKSSLSKNGTEGS